MILKVSEEDCQGILLVPSYPGSSGSRHKEIRDYDPFFPKGFLFRFSPFNRSFSGCRVGRRVNLEFFESDSLDLA